MGFEIGRITRLNLGYVGENESRTIEVDVSDWLERWPDAIIALQVQRPTEDALYIAATELEDGVLRWTITSEDVAIEGRGMAQFRAVDPASGVCHKSRTVGTMVAWSLGGDDGAEVPDASQNWVNQVLEAAKRAEDAAARAEAAGSSAPSAWPVTLTEGADGTWTADKTLAEITQAHEEGYIVRCDVPYGLVTYTLPMIQLSRFGADFGGYSTGGGTRINASAYIAAGGSVEVQIGEAETTA